MAYSDWRRYESEGRWTSYFRQVDHVVRFSPKTCLEVGVGTGFVGAAIRLRGIELYTLDILPELHPTYVGSVEQIPLPDASMDVVLCAEVLEHLPYERFTQCLSEIERVAHQGAVISLPYWGYTIRAVIDLPLLKIRRAWKLPFTKEIPPNGVHCWEIGRTGYPLKRIVADIERYFDIEERGLSPWMPYHYFFRLKKKS